MKKLILLCLIISIVSACHTTKTTTSSNHQLEVKDSNVVKELRQVVDSLTAENSRIYRGIFERAIELSTKLQGSTGEQDTACGIPMLEKQVNIGDDYVKVRGQWHFLDYEIYKAPRQSTSTSIKDSSSNSINHRNDQLQKNLNSIFHSSAESKNEQSHKVRWCTKPIGTNTSCSDYASW